MGSFATPKKAMTSFVEGFDDIFILHYTGDHTVYEYFVHRNSKNVQKPFITSAPFVKEKV